MSLRVLSKIGRSFAQINNPLTNAVFRNSSHASWNYRTCPPPAPEKVSMAADLIMGFAWWWVLWHLFDEYDHIIGEFKYPNPKKWTDEELGVPSKEKYHDEMAKHHE